MDSSKTRLIGAEPLKVSNGIGYGQELNELKCIGKLIISHSFITSEGIINLGDRLLIITKKDLADVYLIVYNASIQRYCVRYKETKQFNSIDNFLIYLRDKYATDKCHSAFLRVVNKGLKTRLYHRIVKLNGEDFNETGAVKEDTNGYIISYWDADEDSISNDMKYFLADSGKKSDNMEECVSNCIIALGEYRLVYFRDRSKNCFNCVYATKEKVQFYNIDIAIFEPDKCIGGEIVNTVVYSAIVVGDEYILLKDGNMIEIKDRNILKKPAKLGVVYNHRGEIEYTRVQYL